MPSRDVGGDRAGAPASLRPDRGEAVRRKRSSARMVGALVGAGVAASLQGQVITEFPIPTASSQPAGITVGSDGNLWFTEAAGNNISLFAAGAVITEYPIPTAGSQPIDIAPGSDGNLWFAEQQGNQIGRITTAGVITEFPVPTAASKPIGIAAGPDGSVWFTERTGNNIGRITIAGVITEFPVPTAMSKPGGIVAGPDGNLWFTESTGNQIGRVTTAGVFTEFPVPTASSGPAGITVGPDGNLWFAESIGNQIGRITTVGVITEFPIPTAGSQPFTVASGSEYLWFTESIGNQIGRITTDGVITEVPIPTSASGPTGIVTRERYVWFSETGADQIGRMTKGPLLAKSMTVDGNSVAGSSSNVNGVLEPGETVQVDPAWTNTLATSQTFTGTATDLTGPAGPIYTINDSSANYGTVAAGADQGCNGATGDCYLMTVSGTRPAQHWDATFTETLSAGSIPKTWKLHVGDSFPDVPTSNLFYAFVENLFHNGVTGGCAGGNYCPTNSVTRAQMAVFLLKSDLGASEVPPPATGTVFADVPASNPFAPWIEQLAGFAITGGCGGGDYCPNNPVTRAQMAVFLLKSEHGSTYAPPACVGIFTDVPCPSPFANWIEQLFNESITGGCGGGNYCPDNANTRGQMAVFLVKTFGLQLYGP